MKRNFFLLTMVFLLTSVYNFTYSQENEQSDEPEISIPSYLRDGIKVDSKTLRIAKTMCKQGWVYYMPAPRDSKAEWNNTDENTTWWYGYWKNIETNKYSSATPKRNKSGMFVGDNKGKSGRWRKGGKPDTPTKLEWLLSKHGGIKPN